METNSKERKKIEEFITKHERAHFLQSPEWAKVKSEWKHEEIILHDENGKINAYLMNIYSDARKPANRPRSAECGKRNIV